MAEVLEKKGDWIATLSGTRWFIMDPDAADVRLNDIAHGLANICRFGGQCRAFYSVAQHSVLVAGVLKYWEPDNHMLQLHGLMHDGSEAYLGDMVRPLKMNMPLYKAVERTTELAISRALGLPLLGEREQTLVKMADNAMLSTERRDLVNHCGIPWTNREEPMPKEIRPWPAPDAREIFLNLWHDLRVKAGVTPMDSAEAVAV